MNELTESTVKQEALTVEQQAEAVEITTNEQYENAATILKNIKASRQKFIDFFAPAKKATDAAHKAVVANEKSCVDPCNKAESIIKQKMLTYQQQLEAQRKAAEEEARKARQAEADKLLEQAAQAEEQGDSMAAEMAMAQADMVSQITTKVEVAKPSVKGVSTRNKTVVKVIDDAKVPAYISGMRIRIVDEKAILTLHKLNPGLTIPGVEFSVEQNIAVR